MIEGLIEKAAVLKSQIETLQEQYEETKRMLLQEMRRQGLQDFRYAGYLVRVVKRHTFRPKDPRSVVPIALEECPECISVSSSGLERILESHPELVDSVEVLTGEYVTLRRVEE
jgi:hypothetical protein